MIVAQQDRLLGNLSKVGFSSPTFLINSVVIFCGMPICKECSEPHATLKSLAERRFCQCCSQSEVKQKQILSKEHAGKEEEEEGGPHSGMLPSAT